MWLVLLHCRDSEFTVYVYKMFSWAGKMQQSPSQSILTIAIWPLLSLCTMWSLSLNWLLWILSCTRIIRKFWGIQNCKRLEPSTFEADFCLILIFLISCRVEGIVTLKFLSKIGKTFWVIFCPEFAIRTLPRIYSLKKLKNSKPKIAHFEG